MRAAKRSPRLALARLLGTAIAAGIFAAAAAEEERITLNFVNTDIEAVATAVGQMVNRNFLLDPRVKGTVNIVSSRPVPASARPHSWCCSARPSAPRGRR